MSIAWTRRRAALVLVAVAFTGAAAAPWWLGAALSAPAPRALGPPPAGLGDGVEAVVFPSDSGSAIHAWVVPGRAGCGAVVLAHSVRSNRLEHVGRAALLRRAGFASLLFDAQAHGESPGERITFGHREALDARAAVDWVHTRLPGEQVGYLGVSQGGAAALLGASPLAVDALVLEAVYPTLREAVAARIAIRLGPLAPVLAPLLLLQVRARLGVDADAIAPIEGIAHIAAPLLLIAGEDDRHTPLAQSQRMFDAAPEPKSLWVVPGAQHVDFERAAPEDYARRVLEFLAASLRENGACGVLPAGS
ncbi:MAG TPA: alpha/beta hydrolase [Myxococcota bacterium]|nr:alpha/beta hydrolase [Myxococcota bacterium]